MAGGFRDRVSILGEFWDYMRHRKKFWIGPILVVLILLGVFIAITGGSALAPFIYALF